MTTLNKPVSRETTARVRSQSKARNLIIVIEPPATVGIRQKGTRRTYRLHAETILNLAIRAHHDDIEKEARRLRKTEGLSVRSARAKARKTLEKDLR